MWQGEGGRSRKGRLLKRRGVSLPERPASLLAAALSLPQPFPLSSRAKPRDLQFYGPFLEMFFDPSGRLNPSLLDLGIARSVEPLHLVAAERNIQGRDVLL
ncbi:MAG: hypothetical protein QOH35_330 [Acidobacteriaceae bacterium]|jgi:hypothetical protein|nr:hypothetical protein [Acidobacteriaceae bacterium]